MVAGLTQQDVELLVEGVARLAVPMTIESLRHESVRVVFRLVPSVSVSWNEIRADGQIDVVGVPEPEPWPGGEEAFARALASHPVIAHTRRTNDGRPCAISDFWTIDQLHASRLYQDFYANLDTEDQLSFTIPTTDVLIGVAVNRDRPGFSQRDRTVANLLRPHILQAYRNAVLSERFELLLSMVDGLDQQPDAGLVRLDRRGAVDDLTPVAAGILSKWFADGPDGRLPEALREWLRDLDAQSQRTPTWPFVFEDGGQTLIVQRLQGTEADSEILHLSERPLVTGDPDLRRLGLTLRQAQVLQLASTGMSNAQIASELFVSLRTVEGHMSEIFDRLGVRSRTAAASIVHQLAVAHDQEHPDGPR